jgi:dienelactone hydrolase
MVVASTGMRALGWFGYFILLGGPRCTESFSVLLPKGHRGPLGRLHLTLEQEDDDVPLPPPMQLPGEEEPLASLSDAEIAAMTVAQLKQQLRLRGLPLSGRKMELVDRLLRRKVVRSVPEAVTPEGADGVDVSAFLDENDRGKAFQSTVLGGDVAAENDDIPSSSTPEVWGAEARMATSEEHREDRRLVVDAISRTALEFKGSNQTFVPAVVVATREALRPYLRGGNATTATEQRLREIQGQREKEATVPMRMEESEGLDEGDETGIFENVLYREVSDWGMYTVTGAQLSSQEVPGVLLLSDVHGAFSPDTTALAEKIAFECQPVVVMIPDLFRGDPWTEDSVDAINAKGQTYEQWRATHDDLRVSVDIRAAAACLRETYGVSSVVVWGTCYGGGRALEAASGWCASVHDVDGVTIGPPPVEPMVVIAWYPTRYNAPALFGKQHQGRDVSLVAGSKSRFAVMGVFAGDDVLPGATPEDAAILKQLLEEDDRIVDHMIKVFPDQPHAFAHRGLGQLRQSRHEGNQQFLEEEFAGAGSLEMADGDAGVASLLSTAFMETYSRVFLPTVGQPICSDEEEQEWGKELTVRHYKDIRHPNIREELNHLNENFVEEPLLSGPRFNPTDASDEEALAKVLRSMQASDYEGPYKILEDDDLPTIYKKLLSSDENFQIF